MKKQILGVFSGILFGMLFVAGSHAAPLPPPLPTPNTPTRNAEWACSLMDMSDHNLFIGYGSFKFVAEDNARRACLQDSRANCEGRYLCGEQSSEISWNCQILNSRRQVFHRGTGRSFVEASYNAAQDCFADSGYDSNFCELPNRRRCLRL